LDEHWYLDYRFFFLATSILAGASIAFYLIAMWLLSVGFDAERIINIFALVLNGALPPSATRLWMLGYVSSPEELKPFTEADMIMILIASLGFVLVFLGTLICFYLALKRASEAGAT
jgi:hypothetical protein